MAEKTFPRDEIIVSKTDLKGKITYVNDVFVKVSGYAPEELLGQPHSIIRHPDMPRGVFRLFWDVIQAGDEIFAYVKNQCKNGDYYWVLAHATPSYDENGKVIGYHSNRRSPHPESVRAVEGLYRQILDLERPYTNARDAASAGAEKILELVRSQTKTGTYSEWIWNLMFSTGEFTPGYRGR